MATTQQAQNICKLFVQCWTNIKDVGPTLYKYFTNDLCFLGTSLVGPRRLKRLIVWTMWIDRAAANHQKRGVFFKQK